MACSIAASTRGGKIRRTRQRCSRRCLPMRLISIATSSPYQLPDAPPPPKLPPPPEKPPPELEPLLHPPPSPDQTPPYLSGMTKMKAKIETHGCQKKRV